MIPEFSRRVPLATIGTTPHALEVEASEEERNALAQRFGLLALHSLRARASFRVDGSDEVTAEGRLQAKVAQSCVVTGEPCEAEIDEPFEIRFLPEPTVAGGEEEIELGDEELDTIFHDGVAIDIGDAVAETLFLALDPYPRAPGAEAVLREAGVVGEAEAGPFGGLAALRDKLKP
jgi:uncharacterized metal-binding protein YceD (DUF177 family)